VPPSTACVGGTPHHLEPQPTPAALSCDPRRHSHSPPLHRSDSRAPPDRRALFAPPRAQRLASLGRDKPGPTETLTNPRARSAVMRVAERTDVAFDAVAA
jgi:hypothetical protein